MIDHTQHPPIGCTSHREFRDLDTKRLPNAPPRPGSVPPKAMPTEPPKATEKPMNKTQRVREQLKVMTVAGDAVSARELLNALGDIDPGTVSALMRTLHKAGNTPELHTAKTDDGVVWWWDVQPPAQVAAAPTADARPPAPATTGPDPLLARIQQMQRPGLPHAQLHADRLRAIAELPIIDAEIALWLEELAGLIEDHADHEEL